MSRKFSKTKVSVADHQEFLASLLTMGDLEDMLIDDNDILIDPYGGDPPSKRKDAELASFLSLLDSLERGNE